MNGGPMEKFVLLMVDERDISRQVQVMREGEEGYEKVKQFDTPEVALRYGIQNCGIYMSLMAVKALVHG